MREDDIMRAYEYHRKDLNLHTTREKVQVRHEYVSTKTKVYF